ncbi:unnamed protein product [Heterobilharzia americana]|nr:unnamed protein product [Heterobilharzia americana]
MSEIVSGHRSLPMKDPVNKSLQFQISNVTTQNNICYSSIQCGSALTTEIYVYRRRIQTLLRFFDCISKIWWDHLYPFNGDFIKRPSRTAEEIHLYQKCLTTHIDKFNMRKVVPATTAIAMMETHASIKILPSSILGLNDVTKNLGTAMTTENNTTLLYKACNLAQSLADIEKLKQKLIFSALNWIMCDGRDYNLRIQRIALLDRHCESCLIENFPGVRALLIHYYRPRILTKDIANNTDTSFPPSPFSSVSLSEPLTAVKLTTTNDQITSVFYNARLRAQNESSENILDTDATDLNKSYDSISNFFWSNICEKSNAMKNNDVVQSDKLSSNFQLNPFSSCIETSGLEWLSYDTHQKDFNLYLLNKKELNEKEKITDLNKTVKYNEQEPLENKQPYINSTKLKLKSADDPESKSPLPYTLASSYTSITRSSDSVTSSSTKCDNESSYLSVNINYRDLLTSPNAVTTERQHLLGQQHQEKQSPGSSQINDYFKDNFYSTIEDPSKKYEESAAYGLGCCGSLTGVSLGSKGLSKVSNLLSLNKPINAYGEECTTTADSMGSSCRTTSLSSNNLTEQTCKGEGQTVTSNWLNNEENKFITVEEKKHSLEVQVKNKNKTGMKQTASESRIKAYPYR